MKFPAIKAQIGDEVKIQGIKFDVPYDRAVLSAVYPYFIMLRVDFQNSWERQSNRPYSERVCVNRANLLCGDVEVTRVLDGEKLGVL